MAVVGQLIIWLHLIMLQSDQIKTCWLENINQESIKHVWRIIQKQLQQKNNMKMWCGFKAFLMVRDLVNMKMNLPISSMQKKKNLPKPGK
jgi:hypothetical protein